MHGTRIPQGPLLRMIQRRESFVYALVTRERAIKIGVSVDLMQRKSSIAFGGVEHFLGYMPGDLELEQRIHRDLGQIERSENLRHAGVLLPVSRSAASDQRDA